jgi:hypothetical protein
MTKDKVLLLTGIGFCLVYFFVYEYFIYPGIARLEWARKIFKTDASVKRGVLYRLGFVIGLAIIAVTLGLIFKVLWGN